ncbi:polyphenol oxidase family protein [Arthrobacter sp. ZGTC212]|uniref:polyphenol oxidase family protein n=1 Tax=Arthrobacter sp. ZGTC212 TaxID=2058899 RepID=UPI000CE529AF|nr:polyphenol oxidase family protein [Arthrobacter sp. ZGTC212]
MFWWQTQAGDGLTVAFTSTAAGNLALHVGDDPALVLRRRRALEAHMGVPAGSLRFMNQVHSAAVASVSGPSPAGPSPAGPGAVPAAGPLTADPLTADALVSPDGSVPLAVMVADCVPVVLAGRNGAGVVTGVAHAGRRGLLDGILANTVQEMAAAGAESLRAWIGPSVCGECYEVPAAMQREAAEVMPELHSTTRWGTPALDLPAGARTQLEALGVDVVRVPGCTLESTDLYSHRRSSSAGRFAGLIWRN